MPSGIKAMSASLILLPVAVNLKQMNLGFLCLLLTLVLYH